ncbi:MAG: hypothetical protein KF872_07360 [Chitinophagales bacterium]|nr:hypothetical protein [Chitinophagales bacterium]
MKILQLFEKAWITAFIAAFIVTIYNFITLQTFDHRVYFPFFCGLFCILIWMNIRGQRKFYDKMHNEKNQTS